MSMWATAQPISEAEQRLYGYAKFVANSVNQPSFGQWQEDTGFFKIYKETEIKDFQSTFEKVHDQFLLEKIMRGK